MILSNLLYITFECIVVCMYVYMYVCIYVHVCAFCVCDEENPININ